MELARGKAPNEEKVFKNKKLYDTVLLFIC